MLTSNNNFYSKHKRAAESFARLTNDIDFEEIIKYLEFEQNRIAFKSCKEHDQNISLKKQGAVLLLHDLINRAKEAREKLTKINERKKLK